MAEWKLTKEEYLELRLQEREWIHDRLWEVETSVHDAIGELEVTVAGLPCKAHDVAIGEMKSDMRGLKRGDLLLRAVAGLGALGTIVAGWLGWNAGKLPPQ